MNKTDALNLLAFRFSKLIPKKKNLWVFGAWFGKAASDNSRALCAYVVQNRLEIEAVWLANDPAKMDIPGAKALRRNSIKGMWTVLRAKVAVMNQGYGDLASLNLLGGAYQVQLWHGVAWKKIVRDSMKTPETPEEKRARRIFDALNTYDLYIAPSDPYFRSVLSAFDTCEEKVLRVGQPRNEVLFDREACTRAKQTLQKRLGCGDKKIVVYMPTFRDTKTDVFSFHRPEIWTKVEALARKLDFVLVEKSHFVSQNRGTDTVGETSDAVFSVPDADAADLLAAADVLITDYSSCFFDYLLTDRPIIHYVYDLDFYMNKDRGVYYPPEEVLSGSAPATEEELLKALETALEHPEEKAGLRKEMRDRYVTYESPENSRMITEEILKRSGKVKR